MSCMVLVLILNLDSTLIQLVFSNPYCSPWILKHIKIFIYSGTKWKKRKMMFVLLRMEEIYVDKETFFFFIYLLGDLLLSWSLRGLALFCCYFEPLNTLLQQLNLPYQLRLLKDLIVTWNGFYIQYFWQHGDGAKVASFIGCWKGEESF